MSSATYQLFAEAMRQRKLIACHYEGHRRVLVPVTLGHSDGEEKALTYQVGGSSSSSLIRNRWRGLFLAKIRAVALREGDWVTGDRHRRAR